MADIQKYKNLLQDENDTLDLIKNVKQISLQLNNKMISLDVIFLWKKLLHVILILKTTINNLNAIRSSLLAKKDSIVGAIEQKDKYLFDLKECQKYRLNSSEIVDEFLISKVSYK